MQPRFLVLLINVIFFLMNITMTFANLSDAVVEIPENSSISAGSFHTVGIKSDQNIVASGYNLSGQCNVSSWTGIKQVSAGEHHSVGLKTDGTVVAVGNNFYGQCDVSSWTDIKQVSAGDYHTVGLKTDGTVVAIGYNYVGQCNISLWTDIIQIDAGAHHTVGLTNNNTVVAAGYNSNGQCNISSWADIVQINAGSYHTVALKTDGTVVAAGYNSNDQCNVSLWADIVQVAAGGHHTVGLTNKGNVIAVGYNYNGQCNVSSWTNIIQVDAGAFHTVGLTSRNNIMGAGDNSRGQCDIDKLEIGADILSNMTGESIYELTQGEEAVLKITAWRNDAPAVNEPVTITSSRPAYVQIEQGGLLQDWPVSTDENGEAFVTWQAGNETGAGQITISAENGQFIMDPAAAFIITPFGSSQASDYYTIDIEMHSTSTTPDKDIYTINKGDSAYLIATITKNSKPVVNEMVSFSASKGSFINIEDGTVLSNEDGVAQILWETGDSTGAGIITVEAVATEETRFFQILPINDVPEDDDFGICIDLVSILTGETIYTVTQGEEALLNIKPCQNAAPAVNELLTVTATTGTFIESQNHMVLTDKNGEASLSWRAGDETGAGYITVSGSNSGLTSDPVSFVVIPFDNSKSSGQADQDSFSFAIDDDDNNNSAVEGWRYDGLEISFTVRVADRYNHPVPQGTVVDFYAEGGAIIPTAITDDNGKCTAIWRSQEPRPDDGRVTVMAVTKGDETFLDGDDDSLYTNETDDLITDMPEAFLDINENLKYDPGIERFLDNDNNGQYTEKNGIYNGSLCYYGNNCTDQLIDIRSSQVIVMSGSFADITIDPFSADLNTSNEKETISLEIHDENENTMPHNSKVEITAPTGLALKRVKISKGLIKGLTGEKSNKISFYIDDELGALNTSFILYIPDEGLKNGVDIDDYLIVDVTTPKGNLTSDDIPVQAYIPQPAQ